MESMYEVKTIDEMSQEFVAISVYVLASSKQCPLGAGSRILFWMCGDGSRTFAYLTSGVPVVLFNRDFSVVKVHTASNTMVVGGRIKFQIEDSEWYDLGPIEPSGQDSEVDVNFESTRRKYLADARQRSELIADELNESKKSGELDNVFEIGSDEW